MRRTYYLSTHAASTGLAMYQGSRLRTNASWSWRRDVLAGRLERYEFACLVWVITSPRLRPSA